MEQWLTGLRDVKRGYTGIESVVDKLSELKNALHHRLCRAARIRHGDALEITDIIGPLTRWTALATTSSAVVFDQMRQVPDACAPLRAAPAAVSNGRARARRQTLTTHCQFVKDELCRFDQLMRQRTLDVAVQRHLRDAASGGTNIDIYRTPNISLYQSNVQQQDLVDLLPPLEQQLVAERDFLVFDFPPPNLEHERNDQVPSPQTHILCGGQRFELAVICRHIGKSMQDRGVITNDERLQRRSEPQRPRVVRDCAFALYV